eukprot:SM000021S06492  [mRNA]  locus=s21:611675:612603:- [translate_table: standard]
MSPPRECAPRELMARAGLRASGMPDRELAATVHGRLQPHLRISSWNPARLLLGVVKAFSPGDFVMEGGDILPGIIEVLKLDIPLVENNFEIPLVENDQGHPGVGNQFRKAVIARCPDISWFR